MRGGNDASASFSGVWRYPCGVYRGDGGLWSHGTSGTYVFSGDGARGFRVDRRGVPGVRVCTFQHPERKKSFGNATAADVSLRQKMEDARRRRGMEDVVPAEEVQRANQTMAIAQAELRSAQVAVDRARLDMEHTVLRAPVDGYITRLRLNKGDYAVTGQPNIALVDASSFRIIGYFEETKLHGIEPGASAQIRLMGFDEVIPGKVVSIGRGIADANQQADAQGLPSVAPSFSWVRLAQRIPVRVEFGQLPQNLVLAAGMTGSIEVTAPGGDRPPQGRLATLLQRWL